MPNYREIIRLRQKGVSQRVIAKTLHVSRNTINSVFKTIDTSNFDIQKMSDLTDIELNEKFNEVHYVRSKPDEMYEMPDFIKLEKELLKPGVTMQLLWEEYLYSCKSVNKIPYHLTQFKKYFREYLSKVSFSDVINHKPAERIEVDWAGTKIHYIDCDTGEVIKAYLFVACLSFSEYVFAIGYKDMKQESWINAHIQMFAYFNGVARTLVPDNLKTGVIKHSKYDEHILNKSYQDMAEHYNTVIIPTRVKKPKDIMCSKLLC